MLISLKFCPPTLFRSEATKIAADGQRIVCGSKILILRSYKGNKTNLIYASYFYWSVTFSISVFVSVIPTRGWYQAVNLCRCQRNIFLFPYNPSCKFIFQNKLIDVFLYGKPEITNFLEQTNVTENLVFTMSVNIKCPLNISNCIEFLNSKSTIKKTKLPYLVLSDFCFLFISFRWQKSDKNPTLIVAMPLTFMHSLPLNWHKNVQTDRRADSFQNRISRRQKQLQREEVILLVSFSIWCILNALFHGNINMLHLLSSSSAARQTGRQSARHFGGKTPSNQATPLRCDGTAGI